jgi:hypothetical protein
MNAPIAAAEMAEEICTLLEQTMLKYFPPVEGNAAQPRPSSVPLVPPREGGARCE